MLKLEQNLDLNEKLITRTLKNLELYKYLLNELKGEKVFIDTDSNKIINESKKNRNFKNDKE